jgi:hypothetical protein
MFADIRVDPGSRLRRVRDDSEARSSIRRGPLPPSRLANSGHIADIQGDEYAMPNIFTFDFAEIAEKVTEYQRHRFSAAPMMEWRQTNAISLPKDTPNNN